MKIVKVEPVVIKIPLKQPVQTSFGKMTDRTSVFVKVHADTGEYGLGEIWNNFPSWGVYEKLSTLKYGIEPLIIGENPTHISKIHQKLRDSCTILGLQWGALGPIYHCISGIDLALWDLQGKHMGKPIYELLGGKIEDEVQVYASGLGPVGFEPLVERQQEMGVSHFKLKVGLDEKVDLSNIKKMRNIIQPNDKLMIDANQAWDRRTAVKCLKQFSDYDLAWIEEPLRCDDLEGLKMVREQIRLPVAVGENLYGRWDVRKALEKNAVDIIQPDLCKNGGITEAKVVVEMARTWDIPFAPHFLSGAVCLVASIHFMASVPGGKILEMDANPNPIREKLFSEPIRVKKGKVKVPEGRGLGYALDDEFVKYYQVHMNEI